MHEGEDRELSMLFCVLQSTIKEAGNGLFISPGREVQQNHVITEYAGSRCLDDQVDVGTICYPQTHVIHVPASGPAGPLSGLDH